VSSFKRFVKKSINIFFNLAEILKNRRKKTKRFFEIKKMKNKINK